MPSFDAAAVAGRLLRRDGLRAQPVEGGRNAAVWRIDAPGCVYALKRYVRSDAADRLERETAALGFFERHDVANVPRVVAADRESNVILLNWLAGAPVSAATEGDILDCVAFVAQLKALSGAPDAAALPDAKEACASAAAVLAQIDARAVTLAALVGRDPALRRFLDAEVAPRRRALASLMREYPNEFPKKFRTLSPSDFGVHNALRDVAGRLFFLDFEYFGWDDPAKLVADFLLHPAMDLPQHLRALFAARVQGVFCDETGFARRLAALLPAYRLRWALIMMNPVLDAAVAAAHEGAELTAAVRTQTERARRFLQAAPVAALEEGERHAR